MKICVLTTTYNNEDILPYFLKHYSQFCEMIVILDNNSTDKTIDIAKSCSKVEGDFFDTNGQYDEHRNLEIKNNYWKKFGDYFDWQIVVDCDEFLYHPDLLNELYIMRGWNASVVPTIGYNMFADSFPHDDKFTDRQLTDIIKTGKFSHGEGKAAIFNPSRIRDINYTPGAHMCRPVGDITLAWPSIKTLHYRYFGFSYWKQINDLYSERVTLGGLNDDYARWHNSITTEQQYSDLFQPNILDSVI